jgi:hypothetical protein
MKSARLFDKRGVLMQRHIISTLTAVALTGIVVYGQQQPPAAQPDKPQATKQTLTGCVVEAKTTDGGKAFVLNNAEGGSAQMYVLAGASASEVEANVNKKVEVTGPVQQPSAAPSEDGAAAGQKVLRPPIVQVESVKVVADKCS